MSNVSQPSGVRPGTVAYFAGTSAPIGWVKANGATVSRTAYADLFGAIGTTFGAGDGATTFALPDLRGEFLRCFDDGRGVDAARAIGSAQAGAVESHTHSVPGLVPGGASVPSGFARSIPSGNENQSDYPTYATGGTETRPRNVAVLACIKY